MIFDLAILLGAILLGIATKLVKVGGTARAGEAECERPAVIAEDGVEPVPRRGGKRDDPVLERAAGIGEGVVEVDHETVQGSGQAGQRLGVAEFQADDPAGAGILRDRRLGEGNAEEFAILDLDDEVVDALPEESGLHDRVAAEIPIRGHVDVPGAVGIEFGIAEDTLAVAVVILLDLEAGGELGEVGPDQAPVGTEAQHQICRAP